MCQLALGHLLMPFGVLKASLLHTQHRYAQVNEGIRIVEWLRLEVSSEIIQFQLPALGEVTNH